MGLLGDTKINYTMSGSRVPRREGSENRDVLVRVEAPSGWQCGLFSSAAPASSPKVLGPVGLRPGLANTYSKGFDFLLIASIPNSFKVSLPANPDIAQSSRPGIKEHKWLVQSLSFLDFQVLRI